MEAEFPGGLLGLGLDSLFHRPGLERFVAVKDQLFGGPRFILAGEERTQVGGEGTLPWRSLLPFYRGSLHPRTELEEVPEKLRQRREERPRNLENQVALADHPPTYENGSCQKEQSSEPAVKPAGTVHGDGAGGFRRRSLVLCLP